MNVASLNAPIARLLLIGRHATLVHILALILAFMQTSDASADICQEKCSGKMGKPVKVCLTAASHLATSYRVLQSAGDCEDAKRFRVDRPEEINEFFENVVRQCRPIESIIFVGHGEDGIQRTGELDTESISRKAHFGCLFTKDAKVKFKGCRVAHGCAGDLFMMATAGAFLNKGGTVDAPTFFTTTIIPLLMPSFSMSGFRRTLRYLPDAAPVVSWVSTFGNTIETEGASVSHRCSTEFNEKLARLKVSLEAARARGCATGSPHVSNSELERFGILATSMKTDGYTENLQPQQRVDVWQALVKIGKQTEVYENCAGGSPAKSEPNSR